MNYRKFPKTGIKISEVSLGAEHLEFADKKTVIDVMHAAMDYGINYVDFFMSSANVRDYGGIALKGRRDKMMVAGHLGSVQVNGQYSRIRDVKKSELFFEDLLTRLKTDYVDMLMLHFIDDMEDADKALNIDGFLGLANKLKKQGKARMLGFSSHVPTVAYKLVESGLFDGMMYSINPLFDTMPIGTNIDGLLDKSFRPKSGILDERQKLYRYCESQQCGIVVMKGYGAGRLLKKESGIPLNMTPEQCIEYALTRPGVVTMAAGCKTLKEVEAACMYSSATKQQRDYSNVLKETNWTKEGYCMYCNHCLPCPVKIDIAKNISLIDSMRQGNKDAASMYLALDINGDDCVSCKICEERCPFGVEIIEKLKSANKLAIKLKS